jgi:hypothetical protein
MSIQSHIENLRSKPEHVRKHIAFWTSFGITLIIFVFWIASFTAFGKNTQQSVADAVHHAGTPVQSLTASVGDIFGSVGSFFTDIKDLVFTPRTVKYTDIQVAPGK